MSTAVNKKKTLVLLDAHALIHRAYHALPAFATKSGEPTGAVYGFLTMILKIMEDFAPDYVVACYDLPGGTFRHEAYKEYKQGRKETDSDLKIQLQTSRDACAAFGIPIYDAPGFEADDMLGTIAEQLKNTATTGNAGGETDIIIASGDMDTLQLVDDDRVKVFTLRKGIKDTILYNEKAVNDRFGFGPLSLPDYKGLRGDTSDNIIGIKGIGEKTAESLIGKYKTLEKLYEVLSTDAGAEKVKKEAKITDRIITLLQDGHDEALFSKVLATIRRDAPIAFSFPDKPWKESLNADDIEALCLKFEFKSLWVRMKSIMAGQELTEGMDGATAQTTAQEQKYSEEEIREVGVALWLTDSDIAHPLLEDIYTHTHTNTLSAARISVMKKLEEQGLATLYKEIEKPLIPIMARMRDHGIVLDTVYLKKLSLEMHTELDALQKEIYEYAGQEFNIKSPKQLGEILFTKLELSVKGIKKTAGGAISTRESELDKLKGIHPIIEPLLRYRELQKLVSTYIDTLPELVDNNSRLHAELLQDGTSTGRFSCQNPNLQNIPIRTDEGKKIRNAFIAPTGRKLVICDYSQIELRVAAMMSGDPLLTKTFEEGKDVHAAVAAQVFDITEKEVSHEQRRRAKIINFGILYGMGVTALQQNLGSTRAEAQEFYNLYFERFPKIREYMEMTKKFAYEHGYTETLFGRRRNFPALRSSMPHIRAATERMVINAPVQGTGADIIKLAMIHIDDWIEKNNLRDQVTMILQVHDELIFEVVESKVAEVVPVIERMMTSVLQESWIQYHTTVPLLVSTSVAGNWGAKG